MQRMVTAPESDQEQYTSRHEQLIDEEQVGMCHMLLEAISNVNAIDLSPLNLAAVV